MRAKLLSSGSARNFSVFVSKMKASILTVTVSGAPPPPVCSLRPGGIESHVRCHLVLFVSRRRDRGRALRCCSCARTHLCAAAGGRVCGWGRGERAPQDASDWTQVTLLSNERRRMFASWLLNVSCNSRCYILLASSLHMCSLSTRSTSTYDNNIDWSVLL